LDQSRVPGSQTVGDKWDQKELTNAQERSNIKPLHVRITEVFIIYSKRKINIRQTYNSEEAIYADCFLFNIIALKVRSMTMRRC
jgi:hypothetical protein